MGGKFLLDRIEEVEAGEFIDTLDGLLAMGYLLATKVNIKTLEDVERTSFRVKPSYAHDLKDARDPNRRGEAEKRRRRRQSRGEQAIAAAMAVAGSDHQWLARHGSFTTTRPNWALL